MHLFSMHLFSLEDVETRSLPTTVGSMGASQLPPPIQNGACHFHGTPLLAVLAFTNSILIDKPLGLPFGIAFTLCSFKITPCH